MRKLNRNLLYAGLAIVLGVVASLLAVHYINHQVAARTQKPTRQATTTVVVPIRNLNAGEKLTADDLATRKVPKAYVSADVLTPVNYSRHLGQVLQTPLTQGTPIPLAAMTTIANQFSNVIKSDHVAYTIQVNETNAISGLISPGDRIDLLLRRNRDKKKDVRVLLKNVLVLATGKRAKDMRVADNDDGAGSYSNLTLELSPRNAQRVGMAQRVGHLLVLLQSARNQQFPNLKRLTAADLFGSSHHHYSHRVQFIIGGGQ